MDRDVTTPLSGKVCCHRLGLATINLYTINEVFMFTHYEDMRGNEKCKNWGGLGG